MATVAAAAGRESHCYDIRREEAGLASPYLLLVSPVSRDLLVQSVDSGDPGAERRGVGSRVDQNALDTVVEQESGVGRD